MSDIASNKSKLNTDEVAQDKPLSEALQTKYGANINYLIDTTDTQTSDIASLDSRLDTAEGDINTIQANGKNIVLLHSATGDQITRFLPTSTTQCDTSTNSPTGSQWVTTYWVGAVTAASSVSSNYRISAFVKAHSPNTSTGTPQGNFVEILLYDSTIAPASNRFCTHYTNYLTSNIFIDLEIWEIQSV